MATCGYICPACEGRGFDEKGKTCSWCSPLIEEKELAIKANADKAEEELKEWVKNVHEGPCCGDI